MKYDIIISINVHEKPEYLLNQIKNIQEYVPLKKKIILNCNDYMLNEFKDRDIQDVEVYPKSLSKRTFHGSLTHGIVRNMSHAVNNYDFDYFLVMSSREFFYNNLNDVRKIEDNIINETTTQVGKVNYNIPLFYKAGKYCDPTLPPKAVSAKNATSDSNLESLWWWPKFRRTKLYQYIESNSLNFAHSMHEGMCYSGECCKYIMDFFSKNEDIMYDLFEFNGCVEEFALQSISSNFKGFYYIGNGCDTKTLDNVLPSKYTYKRNR